MLSVDTTSLLVEADGGMTLEEIERALSADGLTLGLEGEHWPQIAPMKLADWLAQGARGARDAWLDPVDHLIAGLEAELPDGKTLVIRAAPRRAVGPDLVALFVGTLGRFGRVMRATLRVHRPGSPRPITAPFDEPREPPLGAAEQALLDAIERELRPGSS